MSEPRPVDRLGRSLRTLRISATDRCNLRCQYCLPAELFGPDFAFLPREEILSYEELVRVASAFVDLGVGRIRITGGEPLLRRDLSVFISQLRSLDDSLDLALTTNGGRLTAMADKLAEAGLNRVNVSMDALDSKTASRMAGRPVDPESVWQGVSAAMAAGLEPKINTVLKRGVNDDQVLPLARRCREAGVPLRLIEYMDVGQSNGWNREFVVTGKEVLEQLSRHWELKPVRDHDPAETARRYAYADGSGEVGFINSISEPFCRGCDRARISAQGDLYTCLFADKGASIKHWLRSEKLDQVTIRTRLARIWSKREDRYSEERTARTPEVTTTRAEMWTIGG